MITLTPTKMIAEGGFRHMVGILVSGARPVFVLLHDGVSGCGTCKCAWPMVIVIQVILQGKFFTGQYNRSQANERDTY